MIQVSSGNLLKADAEALVNTVNCVGVMGKGIALQFKQAFPENFRAYERACRAGEVRLGHLFIFETGNLFNPRYIINFPTKNHWKGKSRIRDIQTGLESLISLIKERKIRSIAVPPLGCGNGGLDWDQVRPLIMAALGAIPDVQVMLFEPKGAPAPETMPVGTSVPEMTPARALFVKLIEQYSELDYRCSLLEIQKLSYFLQEAGESLRLRFEKGHYGPFAANLNKVLERIEGHFIRGYGDSQAPSVTIALLDRAVELADKVLGEHHNSRKRLERLQRLIEGFETPYGIELLATVHWAAVYSEVHAADYFEATEYVHNWNRRKESLFQRDHVRIAWERLVSEGWIHGGPNARQAPTVAGA